MNLKTVGVVLTACSVTLAAHGAIRASLLAYQDRLQQRWQAQQLEAVTRVVRTELDPLRGDVARAHTRLDQHIAMHIAPAGRQ